MEFDIQKLQTFIGHRNSIYSLSEGMNKNDFFSVSSDKLVVHWDMENPEQGKPILRLISSSYAIHLNKKENLLFVSDNSQAIRVLDLRTNEVIFNIPLYNRTIFDILSHNNRLFLCDNLGNLGIYDSHEFRLLDTIKLSEKSLRKIMVLPETNEIALAFSDYSIKIIDLNNFALKYSLSGHQNSVFTLFFDSENKQLISGGRDAKLIAWDTSNSYKKINEIPAHLFAINHIEDLIGTPYFATASLDKTIKIWEKGTLKLRKVIDRARYGSHTNSINRLLWKNEEQVLLSTGDDRSILMWKLF